MTEISIHTRLAYLWIQNRISDYYIMAKMCSFLGCFPKENPQRVLIEGLIDKIYFCLTPFNHSKCLNFSELVHYVEFHMSIEEQKELLYFLENKNEPK